MNEPERTVVKSLIFVLAFIVLRLLLVQFVSSAVAAAIAAAVAIALFHWLPPRIHRNLTPARSVAIIAAGATTAALLSVFVERLPL